MPLGSHWGIYTTLTHCSQGPLEFSTRNGISIGSAVFAGLISLTDRPTDRPRYSVCNNRPHLRNVKINTGVFRVDLNNGY